MSEETVTRAAVVTGGSRGIGRAVCVALAKQGCNVVVNYCHGAEPAEQTAALCRAEGVDAVAVQADVSTAEGCKTLFDAAVNAFGRVDVLVNNAGITRDGLLLRMSEADFDAVLNANLKGAFLCCKEAARRMVRQRHGRIINLSSVVALRGNAGQANYAASKAGLIGLTKSLAKEHAESFAMFSAPILRVFLLVLRPLNFLFSQWKRLLNMIFHPSEDQGITEEELITMVSEAENEGGLDQHESQLIRSAIEFGDLEAGDILTPRVDIVAVEDSASMEEIAAVFAESGYSRLPVYHKDVDDIVGVIHEKDFNAARYRGQGNISGCITPVHYTTANADLGLLLRTLQKKKTHMAIVVDEYGGTEGLLTMEDILEELVGEIWDEHDEEEVFIRKVDKDTYLVDAAMDFDDFAEFFHLNEETEMTSVSGWVMEQCDRVPEVGDRFSCQDLDVLVTRVDNHRTCEIKVVRREASGGEITDET